MLREGEVATTSHVNSYSFAQVFRRHVEQGNSILYLGFSSTLSVTVKDIVISTIGTTVGSHSGPGTIALFFLSDTRTP